MAETDSKRAKIEELLEYIDTRLTELEEEKEDSVRLSGHAFHGYA